MNTSKKSVNHYYVLKCLMYKYLDIFNEIMSIYDNTKFECKKQKKHVIFVVYFLISFIFAYIHASGRKY